ncbi:hypothetical protein Trydic_g22444 [Trypoxylus dichotomus]
MQCTYLGVAITTSKILQQEVRAQINKTSDTSGYLMDLIWRNKYMSAESKVCICKTAMRPIFTYAMETRVDTTKAKNMMRPLEMKTFRATKGVSLRNQIRSKVREDLEIRHIVRFARARLWFWKNHDRMIEGQWAKWAKNKIPNSRPTS